MTNFAKKERLNQKGDHPITNTRKWERALSESKKEKDAPLPKEQRSEIYIKSTGGGETLLILNESRGKRAP